jgi:glycosyltransferase involved in cell wall biosynthesis
MVAEELRLPLVASWHTNVHEFGARRLEEMLWWAPQRLRRIASHSAEWQALRLAMQFYRRAKLLFAPNRDLMRLLARGTGRPVFPMWRGVDTGLFNPGRRRRVDSTFVLGFVGRIRPEKNVRFLADVEQRLRAAGIEDYRFVVIGQGAERKWLQENMINVEFPGVLKGKRLARAFADMDVFVFPSQTDTFGNVVQEALASGVPAVVTRSGGPKYLVNDGETGYVTNLGSDFCDRVVQLARDAGLQRQMAAAARRAMLDRSWDSVFEGVYRAYQAV